MPAWLAAVLAQAESLSMDSPADRARLAELVIDGLPIKEMMAAGTATAARQLAAHGLSMDAPVSRDVVANAIQVMIGVLESP